MREGGRSYFGLDVTQPDRIVDGIGVAQNTTGNPCPNGSANCPFVPSCIDGGPDCGTLPFPAVLWEMSDLFDEDNNGSADLGDTWSKPNTGRILVREGGQQVVKFVAIFGGGMDAAYKANLNELTGLSFDPDTGELLSPAGNYLYMVDVETGKTIYKRRLDGVGGLRASVPSEPAAVDTDQDGLIDRIYIGTTAGYMFKVNVKSVQDLVTTTVLDYAPNPLLPTSRTVKRVTNAAWNPVAVFSTGEPADLLPAVGAVRRPGRQVRPRLRQRRPRGPVVGEHRGRPLLRPARQRLHRHHQRPAVRRGRPGGPQRRSRLVGQRGGEHQLPAQPAGRPAGGLVPCGSSSASA